MGGFAAQHHLTARALEEKGACRLVCACDPNLSAFQSHMQKWEFAQRKVKVYTDYRQMLAECRGDLDVITIPTPIPLHAPMHRACIEAGLACYLEKPPTLYHVELDEMLAVEKHAQKQTQVGFLYIVEEARQKLRQRMVKGEFGRVRRVVFLGLWPRPTTYFTRNGWAGRLMLDGKPVLDSCIGNAMSHYVHNMLFWAGQDALFSWAEPEQVRAEMYRAHAIEGMDTAFVLATCTNGTELRIAATHAGDGSHEHYERVECERAIITYIVGKAYRIEWNDGTCEEAVLGNKNLLEKNLWHYLRYIHGEEARPLTRLIDSRPFVHLYNLACIASGEITTIPHNHLVRSPAEPGHGEYVAINGIREICESFLAHGRFPSEQGVKWAKAGGVAGINELPQLLTVVQRMRTDRR